MSKTEQYMSKIIFDNHILKYKGQQFEDFFVSIMTKTNPNFQPVKAYGNIGDRKNDGFDETTGTYYQVFAPEDITKDKTIKDGIKKFKEDFESLFHHWNTICPIKTYYFVVNDRYQGLPAPIIEMALELNKNPLYHGVSIKTFLAKDLLEAFNQLDECSKQGIVGFIPEEMMPVVEFNALNETVSFLLNGELPETFPDSLNVPDFDEKITFNNLSEVVNHQLVTGSYQENLLTQYFNENPGVREILQHKFHALYEEAKREIPEKQEHYADSRFFYILDSACARRTISIQTSVLVLMAYYFSSCDIFEEPE